MSKETEVINTNIHFNLRKEEDRKAWNYLQNRDKTKYRSYSRSIVIALNDYFRRQQQLEADPLLETRERENTFLEKISDRVAQEIRQCMSGLSVPVRSPMMEENRTAPKSSESDTAKAQRNRELSESLLDMFI